MGERVIATGLEALARLKLWDVEKETTIVTFR